MLALATKSYIHEVRSCELIIEEYYAVEPTSETLKVETDTQIVTRIMNSQGTLLCGGIVGKVLCALVPYKHSCRSIATIHLICNTC